MGAEALRRLGVSFEVVREKVVEMIGASGSAPNDSPPFTPRAKKVLELSLREALQLNHSYIGTEHILLGLAREGDGVAARVLADLGVDLLRVRQAVTDLMTGPSETPSSGRVEGSEKSTSPGEPPRVPSCPGCSAILSVTARFRPLSVPADDETGRSCVTARGLLRCMWDHVAHVQARRPGRDEFGRGVTGGVTQHFGYAIDRRYLPVLLPFLLRPSRDGVTLTDGLLVATFGFVKLATARSNIAGSAHHQGLPLVDGLRGPHVLRRRRLDLRDEQQERRLHPLLRESAIDAAWKRPFGAHRDRRRRGGLGARIARHARAIPRGREPGVVAAPADGVSRAGRRTRVRCCRDRGTRAPNRRGRRRPHRSQCPAR